jgi:transcriptional regulator CtsR
MRVVRLFLLSLFVFFVNRSFANESSRGTSQIKENEMRDREGFLAKLTSEQRLIFNAMSQELQENIIDLLAEEVFIEDAFETVMDEHGLVWVDGRLEEIDNLK